MTVRTTHGLVNGFVRGGVNIFTGIPYGKDPSGERRFLAPLPADDWDGVKDCTKNGHVAVQAGNGGSISGSNDLGAYFSGGEPERFGVLEETQGEDCLVVNVLTPNPDDKKRPVLVYIHGGGFASGSGSLAIGADRFVNEQDIVLVSVNHRLNIFGFLYLGAFDEKYRDSGMVGMLDIVLALKWVKENIASFGGDINNVTLLGESGGGMKISTLLAMESAKGLFSKAVIESGSQPAATLTKEMAAENAKKALKILGIGTNELNKLTKIPTSELKKVLTGELGGLLGFNPVADEVNLPVNRTGKFEMAAVTKDVPVMIGSSQDELGVFLMPKPVTWDTLGSRLLNDSHKWLVKEGLYTPESVKKIVEVFKKYAKPTDDATHTYIKIVSMASFLGAGAFAQAMCRVKNGAAPVYHYAISYDAPLPVIEGRRYSWHTADLPLQFRVVLHKESEEVSKKFSNAITAFMRTGDPSTDELKWPAFDDENRYTMTIDDEFIVKKDPWKEMREVLSIYDC